MTKVDTSKWKEFRLDELFVIEGTKSLDIGKVKLIDNGINFVGRTGQNNGIQGKIARQEFEPNRGNTITVSVIGNYKYVKYQEEPYYCSQNINKLTPLFKINKNIALFLITYIQKYVNTYNGQQGGFKLEDLKGLRIKLPIIETEEIDYGYMEKYISELEKERISELEKYLKVTGLENFDLTVEEREILQIFNNSLSLCKNVTFNDCIVKFAKFKISDLFKAVSVKYKVKTQDFVEKGYPAYSSDTSNNGIIGYVEKPEFRVDKDKCYVIFGDHTRALNIADKDFSVLDNVKVLIPPTYDTNALLYIFGVWKKAIPNLGYARHWSVAKECEIYLPIKDKSNEIDFEIMSKYIRILEKVIIADVIKYKDKVIEATKKVVNK